MADNEYYSDFVNSDELYHHGIKGQKWGLRRYQNDDGTYTSEGKERRRKNSRDITKEALLKSTDPKVLYANRDRLTNAELQERLNRLNQEEQLRVKAKGKRTSKYLLDKFADKAIDQTMQEVVNYGLKVVTTAVLPAIAAKIVLDKNG